MDSGRSTPPSHSPKTKRPICSGCHRPTPRACICEALPDSPIVLHKCRVVVLQHPHEARRKNRSLPLVDLCLNRPDNAHQLQTVVARRFGDQVDDAVMKLLNDPKQDLLLAYPSADVVTLKEGLEQIQRRRQKQGRSDRHEKINVLLLDATWKHAREMDQANITTGQYPDHLIRVSLCPTSKEETGGDTTSAETANSKPRNEVNDMDHRPAEFIPLRFNIRTPPSTDHLSTAECIAWIASAIEEDPSLYKTLMKPLDAMVDKWRSFSDDRSDNRSFAGGDCSILSTNLQVSGSNLQDNFDRENT